MSVPQFWDHCHPVANSCREANDVDFRLFRLTSVHDLLRTLSPAKYLAPERAPTNTYSRSMTTTRANNLLLLSSLTSLRASAMSPPHAAPDQAQEWTARRGHCASPNPDCLHVVRPQPHRFDSRLQASSNPGTKLGSMNKPKVPCGLLPGVSTLGLALAGPSLQFLWSLDPTGCSCVVVLEFHRR